MRSRYRYPGQKSIHTQRGLVQGSRDYLPMVVASCELKLATSQCQGHSIESLLGTMTGHMVEDIQEKGDRICSLSY